MSSYIIYALIHISGFSLTYINTDTCVQHPALAIDENNISSNVLQVYPNPAGDLLNTRFSNPEYFSPGETLEVLVTDALGKITSRINWKQVYGNQQLKINVRDLTLGNYYISISGEKVKGSVKIIKL